MTWPWRRERLGAGRIDRLVVQQYDPRRTVTIGGIVTCLRGVLDYAPPDVALAVVGVDDSGSTDTPLGRWQVIRRGDRDVWFLPVARLDSTRRRRFVPYAARLIAGLLRYRARIPRAATLQAHRVAARTLDRTKVADAVAALSAPRVVREVFFPDSAETHAVASRGEGR